MGERNHIPFGEIVRAITEGNWGSKYGSYAEAEKALIDKPIELAAYGIVELLRRLNTLGASGTSYKHGTHSRHELKITSWCKKFPGAKVGDRLYCFESFYDGGGEMVIVCVDQDGYCAVTELYDDGIPDSEPDVRMASDSFYTTRAEAYQNMLAREIRGQMIYLEYLKMIEAALEAGEDLSRFDNGYESLSECHEEMSA